MFQLEGLDKYRAHAQSIRLPVHLNLAACKLKKGAFQEVITLCDEVSLSIVKLSSREYGVAVNRLPVSDESALLKLVEARMLRR